MSVHPLAWGGVPEWASAWGEDRFGPYAVLELGEAQQRLRWIRPGTYLRGSPDTEEGRDDWEGPQHQVTLTRGFWLGDTPVTQGLWSAVQGSNPSTFKDPRRPVEEVSWNDVQAFLEALTARVPSLAPRLPTEAEWEYGCRAGTTTATWVGDLTIDEDGHAERLDDIAWYSANSGQGSDLEDGRAGTRHVATRAPNPWGLYDMLGNVYEWCEDATEWPPSYSEHPLVDPLSSDGTGRVFRGGSWDYHARGVRAAYRLAYDPDDRFRGLGFRLAGGPRAPVGGAPSRGGAPHPGRSPARGPGGDAPE